MHAHVYHAEGEAKLWLEPSLELAENFGLSRRRLARALRIVQEHEDEIRSVVEVTNVSTHGFWLWLADRERFLSFEEFPWFKEVSIAELCNVELVSPRHLYWPDLDVDLAVESLDQPERFPLISRPAPNNGCNRRPRRLVQRRRGRD